MVFRRNILVFGTLLATVLFSFQHNKKIEQNEEPLNVVLITLDDMGYGTTGVEGSTVPGILLISINWLLKVLHLPVDM